MGVVHKIKPEIEEFILARKKAEPILSCRSLVSLVEKEFHISMSKSSINDIIKEAGLSMPVGRRQKRKKRRIQMPELPLLEVKSEPVVEPIIPEISPTPIPEPAIEKPAEEEPVETPVPVEEPAEPPVLAELEKPVEAISEPPAPEVESLQIPVEKPAEITPEPMQLPVEKPVEKIEEEKPVEPPAEKPVEEPVEVPVVKEEPIPETPPTPIPEPAIEKPAEEEPVETPVPVEEPVEKPVEAFAEAKAEELTETPCLGAILLKAADALIDGSQRIINELRRETTWDEPNLSAKVELLIYTPGIPKDPGAGVEGLVGSKISAEDANSYLTKLQRVSTMYIDLPRLIPSISQEVRGIKVILSDSNVLYLDGQLHTVWSTSHIPYDFSTTISNIRGYVKRYFEEDSPLALFMAPGYDAPTKEFFDFMLSFGYEGNKFTKLVFYGNRFEEIETITLGQSKKRYFIFGFWPWQFVDCRRVKASPDYRPLYIEALKKEMYISDVEISLLQPAVNKWVTLRGSTLKATPQDKIKIVILSNFPKDAIETDRLVQLYLNRWPNLEEGFNDLSRKIELFTYTANSQRYFSTDPLELDKASKSDINTILANYLKVLELYVRWHFLPPEYQDKDLPTVKERFYSLPAQLKSGKEGVFVAFKPPEGYPYLKDLEYACRRVNEREVFIGEPKKRLWLSV